MADSKKVGTRPDGISPRQERAVVTRRELLRSAQLLFARDGFEHARLEEIAANAGKTRGAFYTHFKSKEEIFFAIFEENADRDLVRLLEHLSSRHTIESRIDAISDHLIAVSRDRERVLLSIEFKLYAIRHPRRRKRLERLHRAVLFGSCVPALLDLLERPVEGGGSKVRRSGPLKTNSSAADSFVFSSLADGLGLNLLFSPEMLRDQQVANVVKRQIRETLLRYLG